MLIENNVYPAPYEISNITAPLCTVSLTENVTTRENEDGETVYLYDEWHIKCPYRAGLEESIENAREAWLAAAKTAEAAAEATVVREKRNALLTASDKYMLTDMPTKAAASEWTAYRAALRGVPEQDGFPWSVVWPEKPEE